MSILWLSLQKLLNRNARDEASIFTVAESKNIFLYMVGIMFYKFALETYLGSVAITAAERFPKENTFTYLGALQGMNQACQCIGSISIATLTSKYPTNKVLAWAIWLLSFIAAIFVLSEAFSGGTLTSPGREKKKIYIFSKQRQKKKRLTS